MGGFLSGRKEDPDNRLTAVEECVCLSAADWKRRRILVSGAEAGGNQYRHLAPGIDFLLTYRIDTRHVDGAFLFVAYQWFGGKSHSVRINLTTTTPRLGGRRWWFQCPMARDGQPCGRRVAKLYIPPDDTRFGCRFCHKLTYMSRRLSFNREHAGKFIARIDKEIARLQNWLNQPD